MVYISTHLPFLVTDVCWPVSSKQKAIRPMTAIVSLHTAVPGLVAAAIVQMAFYLPSDFLDITVWAKNHKKSQTNTQMPSSIDYSDYSTVCSPNSHSGYYTISGSIDFCTEFYTHGLVYDYGPDSFQLSIPKS